MVLHDRQIAGTIKVLTVAVLTVMFLIAGSSAVQAEEVQGPDKGGLKWSICLDKDTKRVTPPAYDEGSVYAAAGNTLYRMNAETGEITEQVSFEGSVGQATIPVTVGGEWIFVPLNGSKVAIVKKSEMSCRKAVYASNEENSQTISPISYDEASGYAYTGSWMVTRDAGGSKVITGSYAAINPSTGETKVIQTSSTGFYWAGACIDGKYVVFGSNSDGNDDAAPIGGTANIYCYNSETGSTVSAEVEGSVCSTVVSYGGKYYFTTKGGKLYEANVDGDSLTAEVKLEIGSPATGNLMIRDGRIYAGCKTGIVSADMSSWESVKYSAPADVKHMAFMGDKILCTYNQGGGGIYDPVNGYEYFTPEDGMKGYCISDIAVNGTTSYYKNDSGYIMAVVPASDIVVKGEKQIKCTTSVKKTYGASVFKLGASADGKLTYSSSVPSVAQVSADGLVTIKGIGKTVITVKAAETESYLPDTAKVTVTVVPKTVSGVKVYAGSRKMTVKWNKMTGITGYQIAYSRSSKFSSGNKYVYVTKYSIVKKTIKKLTKKKYYYVKVRAYKTVSGTKYYGNYSTVKKVKIR